MAATYPLAVKTFTQKRNLYEDVDASHINDLQDEVRALQNVLGLRPNVDTNAGKTYASVAARLNAVKKSEEKPAVDVWSDGYVNAPASQWVNPNWVQIPMPLAELDTDGLSDGTGVTIKKSGVYFFTLSAFFWGSMLCATRQIGLASTHSKVDGSDILTWGSLTDLATPAIPPGPSGQANCNWVGVLHPDNQFRAKVLIDRQGGQDSGFVRVSRVRLQGFMIREI